VLSNVTLTVAGWGGREEGGAAAGAAAAAGAGAEAAGGSWGGDAGAATSSRKSWETNSMHSEHTRLSGCEGLLQARQIAVAAAAGTDMLRVWITWTAQHVLYISVTGFGGGRKR